jgi:hypothetical protein
MRTFQQKKRACKIENPHRTVLDSETTLHARSRYRLPIERERETRKKNRWNVQVMTVCKYKCRAQTDDEVKINLQFDSLERISPPTDPIAETPASEGKSPQK